MKKIWIGIIIIIIVALTIVLFVTYTKKEPKEIKIGAVLELTGNLSTYAETSKKGMDLALDEINSTDNTLYKKIEIIYEDSKSDPKEAVAAFRKLVDLNKVKVVTGFIGSSLALSCAPIANERRVVLFSSGATTPLLSGAGKYVFRNRLSGKKEAEVIARIAYENLKINSICLIFVDNDFGIGNSNAFEKAFQGKVFQKQSYIQGATDFRTELTKLKNNSCEAVYVVGYIGEISNFLRQLKEFGLKKNILVSGITESQDFLETTRDAAEGVIYVIQRFKKETSPEAEKFYKKYTSRYKQEPDLFAALGYDAIYIIAGAVRTAIDKGIEIKDAIRNLKGFKGVMGRIEFDDYGDIKGDVVTRTVRGQKFIDY